MKKSGITNLPLHYGKAPRWLFNRMVKLAREITLIMVEEFGLEAFLKRIADPFWFQSFGCVLGFDWHSSGVTTTVCGALKEGLKDIENEIGIFIAGGKGSVSRKTPEEITIKNSSKVRTEKLIYASKIVAKVDNTAIQDGFQLYQHNFVFTRDGDWAVIQQGMNPVSRYARRYHWISLSVKSFTDEPHEAICCDIKKERVLNMVARESQKARQNVVVLSSEKPEKLIKEIKIMQRLNLPRHHYIDVRDINPDRLFKIFLKTYEKRPKDFEDLLCLQGVGPKTIRALSLISELIYGQTPSYQDPARYTFAHGGKDGHPYPVNREVYDRSINILGKSIQKSKAERSEKAKALERLFRFYSESRNSFKPDH
ncbi:MAG: DUF763 domain-containing protein [Spirochaetes bacterium]|nr:DUF763 domain-containing protein [Spirochaetota bacterium]